MNIEEIKTILPHRDSMLLIDEVTSDGDKAHGKKLITGKEWFLDGHFPGAPVVPGVILCEIMAQSICALMADKMTKDKLPFFSGLDRVHFKSPVRPGDLFETECEITKSRAPFYFAKGKGYVGERLCVCAEFSFALTERK